MVTGGFICDFALLNVSVFTSCINPRLAPGIVGTPFLLEGPPLRPLRRRDSGSGFALSCSRLLPNIFGDPIIVVGNLKHHLLRDGVAELFCYQARRVGAAAPMVRAIEHA